MECASRKSLSVLDLPVSVILKKALKIFCFIGLVDCSLLFLSLIFLVILPGLSNLQLGSNVVASFCAGYIDLVSSNIATGTLVLISVALGLFWLVNKKPRSDRQIRIRNIQFDRKLDFYLTKLEKNCAIYHQRLTRWYNSDTNINFSGLINRLKRKFSNP